MDGRGGLPRFAEDPFFHHRNDDFLRDFPTAPSHRRFGSSPRLLDEEDGFFQSPFDDPTFHSLPRRGVPLRTSQRAQPQPQQQQQQQQNGRSPSQTDINKAGVERPIHVQRQQTVPPQQQQQQQQKSAQQQPPRSPVAKDAQHVTNVPVITVTEPPILEINNANPSSYTNGQLNPDKREQANGHVEHKENGTEHTNGDRVEDMPSAPQVNGTQGGGENGGYTRGKFTTDGCSEQLIHLLDEAERRVEQLRETANQMEQEKEQLLDLIGSVKLNAEILRIRPGERDDINATAERILKRCRTVDVVVNTPRNEEQSRALEDVNSLIQGVITKMQNDLASSKDTVRRFLNACSPDEPDGPIDQRFQAKVVECTADDQKKIRRKLAQLITQIDRAERACAPIV